ncbi:copper resistance CopC family protein [Rhodococcus aetherivorans]|uniref:Copper resistance protein CopC n=2 Tax=Rhodococcus TaxID=1827 RepID=A0ABQ0YSX7_9NOCA|nr:MULTISPECIES: copper resistance CopC family protein [Rhodococcus]KDE11583.1 copper resistance protein CopC [Rhodococcus aetherivorans]UGQ41182.1 copper resistance protein CopC [Rhodococcus aetherivorans]WFS11969.1 copper resistance protein CopC [Rhodococcus aetherivorans]WKW98950.1 copper resistance protein CopC [Rhodococcus aetherivorans]GES39515.1 copper resistance protein CopC [Rhodococcus aetherivorans]
MNIPNTVAARRRQTPLVLARLAGLLGLARLAGLLGAVAAALLFAAGPAAAHSVVIASTPAPGEQIAQGPERVSLTFNEALQESFAALTVVGPDGNLWSKGDPLVEDATVSVAVGDLGPAGEYTIAYRVTSADGHPVTGTQVFTLTQDGPGAPGAAAAAGAAAPAADSDEDSGPAVWVFVVVGVAVLAGVLWFVLRKPKKA